MMLSRATFLGEALRQTWRERMAQLRRDMGDAEAPPAEKLLITHVVLCWLRLHLIEDSYAIGTSGEHTPAVGMYWKRRLTAAQKRYTRAVETLAKVRTLSAATRLIDSRTEAAGAAKRVNNLRVMKSLTA